MTLPDGQYGAVAEPDWGVGMQVSGIGVFDIESFVPRSRDILFYTLGIVWVIGTGDDIAYVAIKNENLD